MKKSDGVMTSKKKNHAFDFGIMLTIYGIMVLLIPSIYYQPDYNELKEREITIVGTTQYWKYRRYGRDQINYCFYTNDGMRYEIRGDYFKEELLSIEKGTNATIKYYRGLIGIKRVNVIKEMIVNGKMVITYSGDNQSTNEIVMGIIGCLFTIFGILFIVGVDNVERYIKKIKRYMKKKLRKFIKK